MKELEKILKEIKAASRKMVTIKLPLRYYRAIGTRKAEEIIRKHLKNDGWIPVEERLPVVQKDLDDDDFPEFNVTIEGGAKKATTLNYSPADGTWFDDLGNVYSVIAWRPLPEPYREGEQEHECDR